MIRLSTPRGPGSPIVTLALGRLRVRNCSLHEAECFHTLPIWHRSLEDSWRAAGLSFTLALKRLAPISVEDSSSLGIDGLARKSEYQQAKSKASMFLKYGQHKELPH